MRLILGLCLLICTETVSVTACDLSQLPHHDYRASFCEGDRAALHYLIRLLRRETARGIDRTYYSS